MSERPGPVRALMTGPFMTGARITLRSMPDFGSPAAVIVQMIAAPMFTAIFYLLLARSGAAGSAGSSGVGSAAAISAALAALVGTCAAQSVTVVSSALSQDRFEGTLPYSLLGVGAFLRSWAGRVCALLLVTLVNGLAALVATALCGGLNGMAADRWPMCVGLIVMSIVSSLGFGLAISAFSLVCRDALFLTNLCGYLLPLLGGVVAPMTVLPQPLRAVAYAMPISWMTDAARSSSSRAVRLMGVALMVGVVWTVIAVILWRICAAVSRRNDTIDSLGL